MKFMHTQVIGSLGLAGDQNQLGPSSCLLAGASLPWLQAAGLDLPSFCAVPWWSAHIASGRTSGLPVKLPRGHLAY